MKIFDFAKKYLVCSRWTIPDEPIVPEPQTKFTVCDLFAFRLFPKAKRALCVQNINHSSFLGNVVKVQWLVFAPFRDGRHCLIVLGAMCRDHDDGSPPHTSSPLAQVPSAPASLLRPLDLPTQRGNTNFEKQTEFLSFSPQTLMWFVL